LILEQSYTSFAMAENLYRLVVKAGPNPGSAFDLSKEVTLMGRDVTNDISLGDPEVSRQHARLTRTPGGYVLEDLGSTNGSFVNGERLVAPRVLTSGDLLGMGENVTLSFEGASPETAQTVMGEAVQHGAAPTPEAMQEAIARPTPVPVADQSLKQNQVMEKVERRGYWRQQDALDC
jgi:pSer/pThr/pTyr-binding forkhead associated (FHA) protein